MSPDALVIGEPDILAAGWVWAQLGRLGSWIGGGTPSKSIAAFWANGSIPWVSPKDMKAEIIKDTEDHITEAAVATSATKFVPPGSVLMVMRSGILRHTFPVAVNTDRVTVNQDLRALIPAEGINPRYVAHYLRGIQRQVLDSCSKDGTTVQSIEFSALERVRVPIAPTAEQRRIMARIDELFAEIADGQAALERARQGLDVWHRALLKAAVTGELTRDWREANRPAESGAELLARIRTEREIGHSGFRLPKARGGMAGGLSGQFHVPEGWAWATIGDIALAVDYGTSEKCGTDPVGVPVLRMGNIQEGELNIDHLKYLNPAHVRNLPLLEEGDILFNRTNSAELVGKTAIYRGQLRSCSFASYLVRLRLISCNPTFVVYWLNSAFGKRWVSENKSQQVGQANLSGGKLKRMPLPLPPLLEQTEIVKRVQQQFDGGESGYSVLDQMDHDIAALRQSILKAAFEGRLVPQDPTDEPASALLARLRNNHPVNGARRRRARAAADFSHPSLPGLTQSVDPRVEPAGDE